jgi:anionic cell wall polymer biosynthesis LytR-Cps2A-Psr (LCP) family protein
MGLPKFEMGRGRFLQQVLASLLGAMSASESPNAEPRLLRRVQIGLKMMVSFSEPRNCPRWKFEVL